ncbi:hypothetical protein PoB_003397900 [Plakobranchus ocellatus]|uniref:Uncharacterized protein n=1 Tax=Plakobranchus ocellatus TaxID=259542 RepID=A0AAV4AIF5_9GAST|nr:hypothetical protein PoB_003397900 [Plakobranchus ocellatus]
MRISDGQRCTADGQKCATDGQTCATDGQGRPLTDKGVPLADKDVQRMDKAVPLMNKGRERGRVEKPVSRLLCLATGATRLNTCLINVCSTVGIGGNSVSVFADVNRPHT